MTRLITLVGEGGLEPPRPEGHWHLKPARLPFRHSPKRPVEPITVVAGVPNRADWSATLIATTSTRLGSDSQSSGSATALRWPDTMVEKDTRDATRRSVVRRAAATQKGE